MCINLPVVADGRALQESNLLQEYQCKLRHYWHIAGCKRVSTPGITWLPRAHTTNVIATDISIVIADSLLTCPGQTYSGITRILITWEHDSP